MIWMLDTNTLIHFCNRGRDSERIARRLSGRSPAQLCTSAISLSELEFGIENSRYPEQNREALDDLLALIPVADYPAGAARHYGEVKAALKKKGRTTQPYDLLIAAHALALDATLVTNDAAFRSVPQLRTVDWLKP